MMVSTEPVYPYFHSPSGKFIVCTDADDVPGKRLFYCILSSCRFQKPCGCRALKNQGVDIELFFTYTINTRDRMASAVPKTNVAAGEYTSHSMPAINPPGSATRPIAV